MRYLFNHLHMAVHSPLSKMTHYLFKLLTACMLLLAISCSNSVQPVLDPEVDLTLKQAVFATPELAVNTLVHAIKTGNEALLSKVIGPDFYEVLQLDTLTGAEIDDFMAAWDSRHTLLPQGDYKMMLAIGKEQWTFPIPIIKVSASWHFDIEEGLERMRIRRIGRNELAVMQTVLAYYDAQMDYAEQDRNGDRVLEYAQKFISTPGLQDGLFWEVQANEPQSPLGTLLANRIPGQGYNGYYYRILTTQGVDAKGGAYNYLIGDHMRSGFAMIAWPEEYGESGVMSFLVSHTGIVYEQNLGDQGASIAKKMSAYNPGKGWVATKEVSFIQEKK